MLKDQFKEYHADNPQVYELFKRYAFQLINRGFQHYSSKSLFERIRWHNSVEVVNSSFKLNNNYTAYYSRLFAKDFPEHASFFQTRDLISVDKGEALCNL